MFSFLALYDSLFLCLRTHKLSRCNIFISTPTFTFPWRFDQGVQGVQGHIYIIFPSFWLKIVSLFSSITDLFISDANFLFLPTVCLYIYFYTKTHHIICFTVLALTFSQRNLKHFFSFFFYVMNVTVLSFFFSPVPLRLVEKRVSLVLYTFLVVFPNPVKHFFFPCICELSF